jgi:hypothetical protein
VLNYRWWLWCPHQQLSTPPPSARLQMHHRWLLLFCMGHAADETHATPDDSSRDPVDACDGGTQHVSPATRLAPKSQHQPQAHAHNQLTATWLNATHTR